MYQSFFTARYFEVDVVIIAGVILFGLGLIFMASVTRSENRPDELDRGYFLSCYGLIVSGCGAQLLLLFVVTPVSPNFIGYSTWQHRAATWGWAVDGVILIAFLASGLSKIVRANNRIIGQTRV